MACCGETPTLETIAAVDILRRYVKGIKVRVVNVVDLMKLQSDKTHPHGLTDEEYNEIFTKNELDTLSKRWRILKMLSQGATQREIANSLNVSLCKVTRGSKILKNKNAITTKYLIKENKNA